MKKAILAGIFILLALLLAGCTQTQIVCGVDEEKCAFLSISVEADWSGMGNVLRQDLEDGMNLIAKHYETELGFTVEKQYTDDSGSLQMTLRRPEESYEAAFEKLKALLTDEKLTPFLEVNLQHTDHDEVQGFGMDVTLDTGRLLDCLGTENLPGDLQETFAQGIANSTAQLCLVLPASELVSGPEGTRCEGGVARVQVPVDLRGQTKARFSTQAVIRDGEIVLNAEEIHAIRIRTLERLAFTAGAALALILAAAVVRRLVIAETGKPRRER